MEIQALNSRLGRKFSLLFLIGALIPLSVVSLIVYVYVSNYVLDESQESLRQETKLFNTLIIERLMALKPAIRSSSPPLPGTPFFDRHFIKIETQSDYSATLNSLNDAILLDHDPAGRPRLGLTLATSGEVLWYTIKPEYLWAASQSLRESFQYCLLTDRGSTLFCDPDFRLQLDSASEWLGKPVAERPVFWQHELPAEDRAWILTSRPIYTGKEFSQPRWHFFASSSTADIYAPIAFFNYLFIGVFGLTLVVISLVAVHQIRRLLVPLAQLKRGADEVSRQQFTPIAIESQDELEDVGHAFNNMTRRISRQFQLLDSLAELDRQILSAENMTDIASLAWTRLHSAIQGDSLLIAFLENPYHPTLHIFQGSVHQAGPDHSAVELGEDRVTKIQNWLHLSPLTKSQAPAGLGNFVDTLGESPHFTAVSFLLDSRWCGFVAVGHEQEILNSEDSRALLQGLAERLAVSLSVQLKSQTLYQQANFDKLTGLPNEFFLRQQLSQLIKSRESTRSGDTNLAVLYLDLDNFQQVNDSLGHPVGDKLLIEVGLRLKSSLDSSVTIARQGGDEFIIAIPEVRDQAQLEETINRILGLFQEPVRVEPHHIYVGASLGVARYPQDAQDLDHLFMNADTALYVAKKRGKVSYCLYDFSFNQLALERMQLENALWKSIEHNELMFHFQPLVNTHSGLIGFEALIRWLHPERGMLSPVLFTPIIEDTGFIIELNRWMFRNLFAQFSHWLRQDQLPLDKLAINISPVQLLLPDFIPEFSGALEAFRIPAEMIELEITESVLLDNIYQAEEQLVALRELGVSLALDDFGTGYSSLSYLQKLPFDRVKIDRSFVSSIKEKLPPPPLVLTILSMAAGMGLKCTAEGIEEKHQFRLLRALGCEVLQGYYISRPLPADQCAQFIRQYELPPEDVRVRP